MLRVENNDNTFLVMDMTKLKTKINIYRQVLILTIFVSILAGTLTPHPSCMGSSLLAWIHCLLLMAENYMRTYLAILRFDCFDRYFCYYKSFPFFASTHLHSLLLCSNLAINTSMAKSILHLFWILYYNCKTSI